MSGAHPGSAPGSAPGPAPGSAAGASGSVSGAQSAGSPELAVRLGPLDLIHPIINASGTMEILDLAAVVGSDVLQRPPVAAYVPKTITVDARVGNRPPRILETPGGMLNAIGLSGEGFEAFVTGRLDRLLELPCPLIFSIGGFSPEEYVALASGLSDALQAALGEAWPAKAGLELNISCPNVHSGCVSIGSDAGETGLVVGAVRRVWKGLLVAKLTPNVTDIGAIGRAAEAAGADAIAAVNTFKGLALDRQTLLPYLGNVTGGLSGPAIKSLALRAVYDLFQTVRVPIIGMGGVATVHDILEFVSCGASVVAVGSAAFREPCLGARLARELSAELGARGLTLQTLRGLAHTAG
jgi:dihydroorotate dehydrogenase (NAD+) catalytic subunit